MKIIIRQRMSIGMQDEDEEATDWVGIEDEDKAEY